MLLDVLHSSKLNENKCKIKFFFFTGTVLFLSPDFSAVIQSHLSINEFSQEAMHSGLCLSAKSYLPDRITDLAQP